MWRIENKERFRVLCRKAMRKYRQKMRDEICKALGNKCVRCGFVDARALQIDHVHDNGAQSRKELHRIPYLKRILKEIKNGSKDYQLLCANCNAIKEYERKKRTLK